MDNAMNLQADAALMQTRPAANLGKSQGTPEQMRKVAEDFEAVFLSQMLQPMFKDMKTEDSFGGGQSEEMWRTMQVDEYGKAIAKSGGIGLADAVYAQMIQMQEGK